MGQILEGRRGGGHGWIHCPWSHEAKIQALARLSPHLEAFSEGGEEAASKIMQVVGRIQFYTIVGVMSLLPCWLPAKHCSHLLESSHIPCHMGPPNQQWCEKSFLCLKPPTTLSVSSQKNSALFSFLFVFCFFKGSCDQVRPT